MEVLQPIFECPICLERLKDPKVLSCFHSLCSLCVQKYAASNAFESRMLCPTCRQVTTIPEPGGAAGVANLPVNSYLVALMDAAAKVLEPANRATSSPSRTSSDAAQRGGDSSSSFAGNEVGKCCGRHSSEAVQLYCASCACLICVQCVLTTCKQHDHKSIASAAGGARSSLTQLASRAGTYVGRAARAGSDAETYRADMREHTAACLRSLEQRRAGAHAALQSAYDGAVRNVQRRAVAWEAKADEFAESVDRSQSECQRQLIEVGELISHRSDIAVVASFAAAERRLGDLLASPWLRKAALAKEKFVFSSGSDFLAQLKKYFYVSSAEELGTELKLLPSAEGAAEPADLSRASIAPVEVGKIQNQKQAESLASSNISTYPEARQSLSYQSTVPKAPFQSFSYPGMPAPTTVVNPYTALNLPQPAMLSYPGPFVYPVPTPRMPQPPVPGTMAVGTTKHSPSPAAAVPGGPQASGSGNTRSAAASGGTAAHLSPGTPSVRSSGSPSPSASSVVQVTQKLSKKAAKKAVKGHLAGLTEDGNVTAAADVAGSAILTYLGDAQYDSKALEAVVGLLFDEACARPEVSRSLARVSLILNKLPAAANCKLPGKTITYKRILQDRIKLELDLKAAGTASSASVAAHKILIHKVQFVVHLFDVGEVNEWVLHDCIIRCLKEESVDECLEYGCGLLAHYGRRLDTQSGLPRMNQHFNQINRIIALPNMSPGLVTMFQDILKSRKPAKKAPSGDDQCVI